MLAVTHINKWNTLCKCVNKRTFSILPALKSPEISVNNISFDKLSDIKATQANVTKSYQKKHTRLSNVFRERRSSSVDIKLEKGAYHPVMENIIKAQDTETIKSLINEFIQQHPDVTFQDEMDPDIVDVTDNIDPNVPPSLSKIYSRAIRTMADIGDFKSCWDTIKYLKDNDMVSIELYCTEMWLVMYESRDQNSVEKVFAIYDEYIKDKRINNKYHSRIYSTIINSVVKVYSGIGDRFVRKTLKIINELKEDKPEVLCKQRLCQAVLRLYGRIGNMDKGMQFLNEMSSEHGLNESDIIDQNMAIEIIKGYRLSIFRNKDNNTRDKYISASEELFGKHWNELDNRSGLYAVMMSIYSVVGDTASCKDMMEFMKESKTLDETDYNYLISAYSSSKSLNNDRKWEQIGTVLSDMKKGGFKRNAVTYKYLLQIYSNVSHVSLQKIRKIYKQMKNDNVELSGYMCNYMVNAGLKYFKKKDNVNEEDVRKYFNWIFDITKQNNVSLPERYINEWEQDIRELIATKCQ